MTLAGVPQVSPAGVDVDTVNVTVPVNPVVPAVSVITDVPEAPTRIWAGLTAPADIEKSWTVYGTFTVWVVAPVAVPVTVTV